MTLDLLTSRLGHLCDAKLDDIKTVAAPPTDPAQLARELAALQRLLAACVPAWDEDPNLTVGEIMARKRH
ncbi:MAG: hypothetical protein ACR2RB_22690 [Gammaproteobacteria bacterium]